MSRPRVTDNFILATKRARVMKAAARVVCRKGVDGATISAVVREGGVARKTFYEIFEGKEDCLEQTLIWIGMTVRDEILGAADRAPAAVEGPTRRGVRALLDFSAAHADRAIFYLLHGPAISLEIYEEEQEAFAGLLDRPLGPDPAARRMLVGGIAWTLRNLLIGEPKGEPSQLLDGFVDLIDGGSRGGVVTPLRSECPELEAVA